MSNGSEESEKECPDCGSSRIVCAGYRYFPDGSRLQRYRCKECERRFSQSALNKDGIHYSEWVKATTATAAIEVEGVSSEKILSGKLLEFGMYMIKSGLTQGTARNRVYSLNMLLRKGAHLSDPDSVETAVAAERDWSPAYKRQFFNAYAAFCKWAKIDWEKPRITVPEKPIFIPQEAEIDALVSGCGKKTSTLLQLLKETGARIGEAARLQWTDVDFKAKVVRITPEKGSNPRVLPISDKLIAMLRALPKREDGFIFNPKPKTLSDVFWKQRRSLAHKLQNSRLKRITLHTIRHWVGTMTYYKTNSAKHVKYVLGHKRLESTDRYISYMGLREESYVIEVAKTMEEAIKLGKDGFELWDTWNGVKIYRKLKINLPLGVVGSITTEKKEYLRG